MLDLSNLPVLNGTNKVEEIIEDKNFDPLTNKTGRSSIGYTLSRHPKDKLCTQDFADRFADYVLNGATVRQACVLSEVSQMQVIKWYNKGKEENPDPDYKYFYQKLREAKIRCVYDLLTKIRAKTEADWKAAAWLLDRQERIAGQKQLDKLLREDQRHALFSVVKEILDKEINENRKEVKEIPEVIEGNKNGTVQT
jgi:hypothetical protein